MSSALGLQPPVLLQRVLDDVGVALAVIDNKRRFVFTNQAAHNMLEATDNLSLAAWHRMNYKMYDSQGREIPPGHAGFLRALAGEKVEPHEVRVTRPDGSNKWFHIAAHPFSIMGLSGVLVVIADETEEIELRKAMERFQRIEDFGVLAGGSVHDFNNILSAISGYVALALSDPGNEEVTRTCLQQIGAAQKKATALVARLMQYCRRTESELRPVQINDVVKESLELARPLINSQVRIKVELSNDLPAVQGDSSQLEQVLVNLILNALDAMPAGGELMLSTKLVSGGAASEAKNESVKQFILISVADTGIGIPEQVRIHIFDPFFTTKSEGKGAGLGLSNAQAIIRRHDGNIEVQSAPGAGATFKVRIPVKGTPAS